MPTKVERALARSRGWIGVRLDVDVDWAEIADVVRDAYCTVAPKTVVDALRPAH